MRIISWNCAMAFRNKVKKILKLEPDILIIQESECMERVNQDEFSVMPTNSYWFGNNKSKGISIFTFNNLEIELLNEPSENDKWIIPFRVNGSVPFRLYAVWAMNHRGNSVIDRISPTYATFMRYQDHLKENVVIIGDFNDNAIWDKKYFRKGCFSELARYYEDNKIKSCYHQYYSERFGLETRKTICWRKKIETSYHIDYCFASDNLIEKMSGFELGSYEDWLSFSDHVPLIVDFDL